jgi:hypothetical protein
MQWCRREPLGRHDRLPEDLVAPTPAATDAPRDHHSPPRIVLIAYACNVNDGSEGRTGWGLDARCASLVRLLVERGILGGSSAQTEG